MPLSKGEIDLSEDPRKLAMEYPVDPIQFLEYISTEFSGMEW